MKKGSSLFGKEETIDVKFPFTVTFPRAVRETLPNSLFVGINEDLSDTHSPQKTGRHPLPLLDDLTIKFTPE